MPCALYAVSTVFFFARQAHFCARPIHLVNYIFLSIHSNHQCHRISDHLPSFCQVQFTVFIHFIGNIMLLNIMCQTTKATVGRCETPHRIQWYECALRWQEGNPCPYLKFTPVVMALNGMFL